MSLPHIAADQISLPHVLAALGDPTRLAIVRMLADSGNAPIACGGFAEFGSKTNISYHLAKLREAGITRTEIAGTSRLISLRAADLDARFPGLLDSILAASGEAARAHGPLPIPATGVLL
ncbi:ArsR/SmtB family transcription factor [Oryzicola mucosus]|uniref:Helix-turn-helix transcriptional regulator n=1 Tax=Oryzicola mucosus TaxID=2767425 RepID=A0A8J6PJB8_9HYPH|nr:helix-turn-helix transcriptional regulator [Oryzicola mucosus]MBD0414606.1 helix-turn-helix transcriptional regulator [Oryzicola mucosus]